MDRIACGMSEEWLAPFILLVLRDGHSRADELSRSIAELGFGAVRSGEFYRTLRGMEREGMISATPELPGCWPPLGRYGITESGEAFLGFWADYLEQYRGEMDLFLRFYSGAAARVGNV